MSKSTLQSEDSKVESHSKRNPGHLRRVLNWLPIILGLTLTCLHWFQFDSLAAVTLVPPWLWLVPATILIGISFRSTTRKIVVANLVVWSTFIGLNVEEARSLIRPDNLPQRTSESPEEQAEIRVVSLNCHVGSEKAALEVLSVRPDIVLFQESPGTTRLEEIASALFGEQGNFISCGDTSIVSRGELTPIMSDKSSHFAHAKISFPDGQQVDVVSLRLSPPVFRIDFWNAGFWKSHQKTRQKHRTQIEEIVDHLENTSQTDLWIVGGDFNLPGNDGALSPFEDLTDTFFQAGSGWSNTGTNQYPLFRVDQIWISNRLRCSGHRTFKTEHSDHRMVVVDLLPTR